MTIRRSSCSTVRFSSTSSSSSLGSTYYARKNRREDYYKRHLTSYASRKMEQAAAYEDIDEEYRKAEEFLRDFHWKQQRTLFVIPEEDYMSSSYDEVDDRDETSDDSESSDYYDDTNSSSSRPLTLKRSRPGLLSCSHKNSVSFTCLSSLLVDE